MSRSNAPSEALRAHARKHPGTSEGSACAGTALESTTILAGGKTFLFLREDGARLKLRESLAEATRLAKRDPEHYAVGAGGWVKVSFEAGAPVALEVLKPWVDESYRLFAAAGSEPAGKPARKAAKARPANARRRSAR